MRSGHHTQPHLPRHPISPSSLSPMRCMAHHALSASPTCSPSCRVLSVASRAAQPSLEHNDGPSQSHETSPWLSHMPTDVSASWTHPLAHRTPAEQPISCPTLMPHCSDMAPCAVMHHHSVTHPTTVRAPSTRYDVPDHRDTSAGPLNHGPPPWDASLHPNVHLRVPRCVRCQPDGPRLSGTAGMPPGRSSPPVVRLHDLRMPPACTTACPNPRAHPQGSRTPARQPAGRPKLRRTPAAIHPTVTRPRAYSTRLVRQMTCPTLGHVPGHVAHQPGITQATQSVPIARPTAVERLAPAVPPLGLGHIPAPSEPKEDTGGSTPRAQRWTPAGHCPAT